MVRVVYSEEIRNKAVEAVVKDKKKMLDVAQEHGVSWIGSSLGLSKERKPTQLKSPPSFEGKR